MRCRGSEETTIIPQLHRDRGGTMRCRGSEETTIIPQLHRDRGGTMRCRGSEETTHIMDKEHGCIKEVNTKSDRWFIDQNCMPFK